MPQPKLGWIQREICMTRPILLLVVVPFSAFSALAVWRHGYWGLFAHPLQSLAGLQVLADLAIALALVLTWLWTDARAAGRSPWPGLLLTMTAGSFGPLLYRVTGGAGRRSPAPRADRPGLAGE